ncbi:MAG TPA: aminoacyl-tRNA hydrolase [Spirochaetia bacterium]
MVVGLGNPGERYAGTRHNVGFMVVDALAERLGVQFKKKLFHSYLIGKGVHRGTPLHLLKPLTFMNDSGRAVREALREIGAGPGDLLVVCDTLDLPPGAVRLKVRGSSAGQKGLQSIITALGTDEFPRIVLGIGRPAHKGEVVAHVLTTPKKADEEAMLDAVERASEAVLLFVTDGATKVMNEVNRRGSPRD